MKKINTQFQALAIAFLAILLVSSCTKDDETPFIPPVRAGLYILNEGGFNSNNAGLGYFNFDTQIQIQDLFVQQNNRGLGDTGNDAQIYGSKMYIVVNASNTVEVVNAKTAKSIKQISFVNNGVGRQPRYVIFNKNKAFISSYDGTVAVLDTATLTVDKYITVGRNPEQMAIANNKIYVANSGGLDYPNYDNTVSVIDLNTLTEIKKITVVLNPRGVVAAADGRVYVKSTGNYGSVPASLSIIDSKTDLVKSSKAFTGSNMQIVGQKAYFLAGSGIQEYDMKGDSVLKSNIITDATTIKIPYGLNYDEANDEFFVCDAVSYVSNGQVLCYSRAGVLKYKLNAGPFPNTVIFINK